MSKRLFITGTDTGVGKTHIACGLLYALAQYGYTTIAIKPLASGAEELVAAEESAITDKAKTQRLWHSDALALQQAATIKLDYALINPMVFKAAIAPHLAAAQAKLTLTASALAQACNPALSHAADYYIIEGAGGLYVPLNSQESMLDLICCLDVNVILVVGMRLGCLNHALLSYFALQQYRLTCVGWVANCVDADMLCLTENIHTLTARLACPLLGVVPFGKAATNYLQINLLS